MSSISEATWLIQRVDDGDVWLCRDQEGQGYACIFVNESRETWPIRSKSFRSWLVHQHLTARGKAPNSQALTDAVNTIDARAEHYGQPTRVHTRVGEYDGRLYLDLSDPQWRAVEVGPQEWRLVINPPVLFTRTTKMHPLPEPQRGAGIDLLWRYLNVSGPDRILVLAWLLAALRPKGPYPILVLQGEPGSAKSTTSRVLRELVDPAAAPVRSPPRNEQDSMVAARNGWVIAFDNLSGLPVWLSDALCRLATGGGSGKRELYTNGEEFVIDVQRPVMVNGIDTIATRQDLIDRAIVLDLPRIADAQRCTEREFWDSFYQHRPFILGALLDLASSGLRNIGNVQLSARPRMADFAVGSVAALMEIPALDNGPFVNAGMQFLSAFQSSRLGAVRLGLDASPVARALIAFMTGRHEWQGTATELLGGLTQCAPEETRQSKAWPKAPHVLSGRLREQARALRDVHGIDMDFQDGGERLMTIRRAP